MIDTDVRKLFMLEDGVQIERHVRVVDTSFVFTNHKGEAISKKQKITQELTSKVVTELVGEEALPIIFYLKGKKQISEFIIAEELDMEIHFVRNLLYRLLEYNIVSFIRKKDRIKGWYICYWDFNEPMVPYLAEKIRLSKIAKLKDRLEKEQKHTFYMCRSACVRMPFEKSMEFNFKCPECGGLMNEQDNNRTREQIQQQICELEKKKDF
jgi:transcription initiation factor TFIIE subunit alpha